MKKRNKNIFDYLLLTLISSIAVILVLYFNGNKSIQEVIIISFSILYIIWGVLHHAKEHTLETKVVLEYAAFSLLGSILVIGLLK
jgi:hypothetical protein